MRSTVFVFVFGVFLVVVVIASPCFADVKNDFHETKGGIVNYTAEVSGGGLGETNSSGMLLGERKFSGGNGGKGDQMG